jgi:hypothetical protein
MTQSQRTTREDENKFSIVKIESSSGKVDVPNPLFDLKWTPIFAWCMVGYDSMKGHRKKHVLERDWTTHSKSCNHSRHNSQHNLMMVVVGVTI